MDKSWDGSRWVDDFRIKLKATRQNKGLTQAQLAGRAGLSLEAIRTIEQGVRRPSVDTLRRLAVVLQVDVSELLRMPAIDPASETHEVIFS
jgi:transcriptional regulator with XRE-family HTH domain